MNVILFLFLLFTTLCNVYGNLDENQQEQPPLQQIHLYINEKKFDEAAVYLEKLRPLSPNKLHDYFNLANLFCQNYLYEQALLLYDFILANNPTHKAALYNKAYSLKQMGKHKKAIVFYEKVLAIDPNIWKAHQGIAQSLLATGNFERGWYEFQWRLKDINTCKQEPIDPTTLAGKSVVLRAEFGLGDMIQFVRYAKLFKQYGAYVIVQTDKKLVPLFSLCNYIDRVVETGEPIPIHCMHVPLLSTPIVFQNIYPTVYAAIPYLYAHPTLEQEWKEKLAPDTNIKIGICWQANPGCFLENNPYTKRSVPLKTFAPLAQLPGISLYSLQKINGIEELHTLADTLAIHTFETDCDEKNGAFMDTAAIMKNLDLIITVDTVTAHLAGALGVPVWLILPSVAECRWLIDRTDSPWYPTMRLFRKRKNGSWQEVIQEISNALTTLYNKKIKERK